ncbi:baseplate J/gp47 family protein [Cohnella algarum]|uniref:baseplate J/gp47 family protein n=1 Tax=Cohnella algarum TaxID=2044859 RepID=UPI0019680A6E|nr:baseplate J/gp47 family protein [Cohnella algarum]MBN2980103.1 baseplate J/gp47 family protein [Cohnella algarum]
MYETLTYEVILQRMLDRVRPDVDKRQGSLIYDALAPAAAELAQMYIDLDINRNLSFADTASGDELARRTAEFGVNRRAATSAIRKGVFYGNNNVPVNVPIGSRYGISGINYTVAEQIATGEFSLRCETAGTIGNQYFGAMLPIEYVAGLVRAELTDVLVPGEDQEPDAELRQRYYEAVNEPRFGGNVSDYRQTINEIDGVGGTKVFPVWQGGGTVKCTIIAADWNEPSQALIDEVQTIVDPTENSGEGLGTAPIGHRVTITGVQALTVNVVTTVTLASGTTVGQVQGPIEDAIGAYLLGLRRSWANETELVARVAQIDAAILTVPGVIDVRDTALNGAPANLTFGAEEMPALGTVTVNV